MPLDVCLLLVYNTVGWLVDFLQHDIPFLQKDKEDQMWNVPDPEQEYESLMLALMHIYKLELKIKHTEE